MPDGLSKRLTTSFLLMGFLAAASSPPDVIAEARQLAALKRHSEAAELLKVHLQESPADVDARLVRGLILSWNKNYAEARTELQTALAGYPGYTDISLALINVELWDNRPREAERVARQALERTPNHTGLLVGLARALREMNQAKQALAVLDRVLEAEPRNVEVADLRRAVSDEQKRWHSSIGQSYIRFSDGSSSWREQSIALKRGANAGSMVFRFNRAARFGLTSNQVETDWYPSLRKGTYAYLNAGYSPDSTLYPVWRAGADLFQNLGHGVEASGGVRRLAFQSARINVYTASLGRYYREWYGSVRTFVTPDKPGASVSMQFQGRRYFGDREKWINFRFGRGATPFEIRSLNEIGVLHSTSYAAEFNWLITGHGILDVSAGAARQDRVARSGVWQTSFSATFYYRF